MNDDDFLEYNSYRIDVAAVSLFAHLYARSLSELANS